MMRVFACHQFSFIISVHVASPQIINCLLTLIFTCSLTFIFMMTMALIWSTIGASTFYILNFSWWSCSFTLDDAICMSNVDQPTRVPLRLSFRTIIRGRVDLKKWSVFAKISRRKEKSWYFITKATSVPLWRNCFVE